MDFPPELVQAFPNSQTSHFPIPSLFAHVPCSPRVSISWNYGKNTLLSSNRYLFRIPFDQKQGFVISKLGRIQFGKYILLCQLSEYIDLMTCRYCFILFH